MKKRSESRLGHLFKQIFNLRLWCDWDRMKAFTLFILSGFKAVFVPQKEAGSESFEAAQAKLNLTDADILARQKGLLRLSILMVIVAILLFVYAIYQFMYGSILGHVVSIVVTLIALVLAFRYHFWYFQIKERKLGCSFSEWFRQGLLGDKR